MLGVCQKCYSLWNFDFFNLGNVSPTKLQLTASVPFAFSSCVVILYFVINHLWRVAQCWFQCSVSSIDFELATTILVDLLLALLWL